MISLPFGIGLGHLFLGFVFLVGALGLPMFIAFFAPSIPTSLGGPLARMLWTIGALSFGPYALDRRESGRYELNAVTEIDGSPHVVRDGKPVEIENGLNYWWVLGKQQFGITYEKTEKSLEEISADEWRANPKNVGADGGDIAILDGVERASFGEFTSYPEGEPEGEILLDSSKLDRLLQSAGGAELGAKAKEVVLRDEGGGGQLSMAAWAAALIMALVLGVSTGIGVLFLG